MEYDINVNNNNYKKRGAYMKIYEENGKLYVESDYSREFVKGAKLLNGTWSGKAWVFNPENEEHVRKRNSSVLTYRGEAKERLEQKLQNQNKGNRRYDKQSSFNW